MDCGVSPILEIATRLWDCTADRTVYIQDLQENLDSLRKAMEELKNVAEDVKTKVDRAEKNQQMRRTLEVEGWLHCVAVMEKEVDEILQKADQVQKKCLGTWCSKNCCFSYKLGKIASKKLHAVTELRNKGRFGTVVERLPRARVEERQMEMTVGLDLIYAEVCRCIRDEKLGIIGLYGMGGAGKTTLMTKVNNEFIKISEDFEIVIWVVVSKSANVERIQEVIRNKLEIPDDKWKNRGEDEKAVELFNTLKSKRYVMLLDDVWERLDLKRVGIPLPDDKNKSKAVLTTRSWHVCRDMEAQKSIKVECLTQEEAFVLFQKKVGENTLNSHPDIDKLAKIVVQECKGLPLALTTIGRAMAGRNTPQEWERAIQVLKNFPSKFAGMGDHVFPILKFSYDSLKNDVIKSCFLYFSIFREDYEILNDHLIDLWIGEGLLDEYDNLYEQRNHGHDIIEHLKVACLFENGEYEDRVKMHDVIRDMALWLASEYCGNKYRVVVQENSALETHQVARWKEAQQISLWNSSMEELTVPPYFPNLQTLIVKNGVLHTFPNGFFEFMPAIKVLDFSRTPLIELPAGMGKLVSLQYLNLSFTKIRSLPMELTNLTNLKCMILNSIASLEIIPVQLISSLKSLQLFSITNVNHSLGIKEGNVLCEGNKPLLEELECLQHMNEISILTSSALAFDKLLSSQKLQKCIRWLSLENFDGMISLQLTFSSLQRMKHLKTLVIRQCLKLKEIKIDWQNKEIVPDYIRNSEFHGLRMVFIFHLPELLNLTWLVHISSLECLSVYDCESMEEVICYNHGISENLGIFARLKYLLLWNLPSLKSICDQILPFPSLIKIEVRGCQNLKKLPWNSSSASNSLKGILGESKWWEGLQWEDEILKHTFSPYFESFD